MDTPKLSYIALPNNLFLAWERSRIVDRNIVRLHLLVVPHRMPARRAAVYEQQFGLVVGQRVTLDVVAIIVPFESEFPPESLVISALHAFAPLVPFRNCCLQIRQAFKEMDVLNGEARKVDT